MHLSMRYFDKYFKLKCYHVNEQNQTKRSFSFFKQCTTVTTFTLTSILTH